MKKTGLYVLLISIILSCSDKNGNNQSDLCDFESIINTEQFQDANVDPLTINSMEIEGDCLKINFSASGCSGDSWILHLIDSGEILESFPPQRNLKFSLKNSELCEAYITKEISFDISNLQAQEGVVQLNIVNSEESILYDW